MLSLGTNNSIPSLILICLSRSLSTQLLTRLLTTCLPTCSQKIIESKHLTTGRHHSVGHLKQEKQAYGKSTF